MCHKATSYKGPTLVTERNDQGLPGSTAPARRQPQPAPNGAGKTISSRESNAETFEGRCPESLPDLGRHGVSWWKNMICETFLLAVRKRVKTHMKHTPRRSGKHFSHVEQMIFYRQTLPPSAPYVRKSTKDNHNQPPTAQEKRYCS